mgnify:FL=1
MKQKTMAFTTLLFIASIFIGTPVFANEEKLGVKEIKPTIGETHHLEVKPESLEGYRLPYMKVAATIIDQETKKEKKVELHPMFGGNFHYGANVMLEPKQYILRFHLDAPTFTRTDKRKDQWLQPFETEFVFDASAQFDESVEIGKKETQDMKILFVAEHAESMFILEGTEAEHGMSGHQTANTQARVFSTNNNLQTVLYGVFLFAGFILGFTVLRYAKPSSKKAT